MPSGSGEDSRTKQVQVTTAAVVREQTARWMVTVGVADPGTDAAETAEMVTLMVSSVSSRLAGQAPRLPLALLHTFPTPLLLEPQLEVPALLLPACHACR